MVLGYIFLDFFLELNQSLTIEKLSWRENFITTHVTCKNGKNCSSDILWAVKNGNCIDRRGFHPPCPTPIKIFFGQGFPKAQ